MTLIKSQNFLSRFSDLLNTYMKNFEFTPNTPYAKKTKRYAMSLSERVILVGLIRDLESKLHTIELNQQDTSTLEMLKSFTPWFTFAESRMFDISAAQIYKINYLLQKVFNAKITFWTWTKFKDTGKMSYLDFEAHALERDQVKKDLKWKEAEKIAPGCRTRHKGYLLKH